MRLRQLSDGGRLTDNAAVIIEDGPVACVGTTVPPGAEVIDLRRDTGLHGLIDLDTHMTSYSDRIEITRPSGRGRRPAVTVYLARGERAPHARERRHVAVSRAVKAGMTLERALTPWTPCLVTSTRSTRGSSG